MILRPSVLPDELAAGYKARVQRINGWNSENEATQAIQAWADCPGASRRNVSTVDLLARIAGTNTPEFVRAHTMVPLLRAVSNFGAGIPHGSSDRASLL
jgi:hypothetical protein